MTPGEIHGLHKQVVDDLKAQLAAAREEARNERTRAEAAEQELFDQSELHRASMRAAQATADVALRSATPLAAKLAAIRAHKPALDRVHAWLTSGELGKWTYIEGPQFYDDAQSMAMDVAAAREALEP